MKNNTVQQFIASFPQLVQCTANEFEQGFSAKDAEKEGKLLNDAFTSSEPAPNRYFIWAEQYCASILTQRSDVKLRYEVKKSPSKYLGYSF